MKIQRSLGYLGALIIGGLIVYSLRSFYIDRIRGEKKTTRISHVDRKDILYDKLQIILNMIPLKLEYNKSEKH